MLKSLKNEIQMQYNHGERLRFTGRSGFYSTVYVLVPTADENIQFNFVPCTDGDNNHYSVVKIGNKLWMTENFKSLKTANGQIITEVYAYADNLENAVNFERLYTWQAAVNAAPQGWHLPSKEEWQEMINLLGDANLAGGKLKETGTFYWNSPNSGATNSVGFSAIAGGFRGGDGVFYDLREHGPYWGSANNAQIPYCIYLYNTSGNLIAEESPTDLTSGIAFAVRYIRD